VILAAGTLGSTEILLRSRERGLSLSDQLGKGFSGNGDEMLIGRDLDAEVNAVAVGVPPRANVNPVGPATIAMIRCRDQDDQDATVLLQDGTMLPLMAMMAPLKAFAEFRWTRAVQLLREGRYHGYRSRAQVYYLVTHDSSGGELRLVRDRLVIDWPHLSKDACFERGGAHCKARHRTFGRRAPQ
jgi:cholesterol oxidase